MSKFWDVINATLPPMDRSSSASNIPDAFAAEHTLSLLISLLAQFDQVRANLKADQNELTQMAAVLRRIESNPGAESLHSAISQLGNRLEARLEEIRDAVSEGARSIAHSLLRATAMLLPVLALNTQQPTPSPSSHLPPQPRTSVRRCAHQAFPPLPRESPQGN